jgi:hypothetical protein
MTTTMTTTTRSVITTTTITTTAVITVITTTMTRTTTATTDVDVSPARRSPNLAATGGLSFVDLPVSACPATLRGWWHPLSGLREIRCTTTTSW